jgi:CelD/BcsL family acetyltransferase involved in cellulose biosynthesis
VIVQAYVNEQVFAALESEWNTLVHKSQSNRIFSTWEWNQTWWNAYHPGRLWVVTVRNEDGELTGIAPCFIETTPDRRRVVRLIGCVDVTDYVDLIINPAQLELTLQAMVQFLAESRSEFEWLDFCNLPEASPVYRCLPKLLGSAGFSTSVKQQEVCPVIVLPTDWETYVESLDKKDRHELRRKLRRAESDEEAVEWYIVGAEHDLKAESERFLALMAASQEQKQAFLENAQNREFFNQIVPILRERGWLQMSFLTINGEAAASYLNFLYEGHVQVYNSGLNMTRYSHLSAGIVLLAYNIKYAIEHGYQVFDFLRGNETYKYRMGAKDTGVFNLEARLELT